jgi:hypothetical protein
LSALLCTQRTRREVADDVCSTVLVGLTSSGKSALLNTALLLTEVDERTYSSREHKANAPRFNLRGSEVRLEAVGIIRDLLLDEGVKPDDLDAKLAACVHLVQPKLKAEQQARAVKIAAMRERAGSDLYGRVEQYLLNTGAGGSDGLQLPDFLFHVGDKGEVTTRLATAARYGHQYHVFGHVYTEEEVLIKARA